MRRSSIDQSSGGRVAVRVCTPHGEARRGERGGGEKRFQKGSFSVVGTVRRAVERERWEVNNQSEVGKGVGLELWEWKWAALCLAIAKRSQVSCSVLRKAVDNWAMRQQDRLNMHATHCRKVRDAEYGWDLGKRNQAALKRAQS